MGAAQVRPGDQGQRQAYAPSSRLHWPTWLEAWRRAGRAGSALLACVHADCLHPPLLPLGRLPRRGHSSALGSAQEPQTQGSGSRET